MNRSSFLAASAAAPAAALAVPGGTNLVERRANFDEAAFRRAVERPDAEIRQLCETVSFHPGILNNVKNALNGLQFGYGYPADRLAYVVAPHGPSSAYTYTDYVWSKYRIGEAYDIKDAAGAAMTRNAFYAPKSAPVRSADPDAENSFWQDTSVQTLQQRGVVFLTCHTAVEEQARALLRRGFAPAGMTASHVAADILTHLIPGTHVVPSMVATIAVLQQRYHYTYLSPAL